MPPLDPSTSNLQNLGKSTPKVRDLCKSAHNFRKLTIPWSSMALDRQNPKKFETKKAVTRRHAPLMTPVFAASTNTCSHVPPVSLTRLHAPGLSPRAARHTRALWRHGWHLYDVTTHYGLTHLSRPTQFDPFILTRSEPPAKKKKKKLWPSRTLTLTKKSKFSKRAYSTQFLVYIPILESVSLFETWKLC